MNDSDDAAGARDPTGGRDRAVGATEAARQALLTELTGRLLAGEDPDLEALPWLYRRLSEGFGVVEGSAFVVTEGGDRLRLGYRFGLSSQEAEQVSEIAFGEAVCGTVAATRTPLQVEAVDRSTDPRDALIRRRGVRAYVCEPLLASDRLLGTISFGARDRDRFAPAELDFFHAVALHVAVARQRWSDLAALAASERRTRFLLALSERLHGLGDAAEMAHAACDLLGRQIGAARVGFAEVTEEAGGEIIVRRTWSDGRLPVLSGRRALADFGPGFLRALEDGGTARIADLRADPRTGAPALAAVYEAMGARAMIDVPLVRGGRVVALLFVHEPEPRAWSEEEAALAEEVGARLWSAVERAHAESRLRESEERFRGVFQTMFNYVGRLSPDGTVLAANDAALAMGGLEAAEVVGRKFWDTGWWDLGPAARERLREAVARAARGELVRYEAQNRTAAGGLAIVDFSLRPVFGDRGRVVEIIPEGRDLTLIRQAEAQIRLLVDGAQDHAIYLLDPEGRILTWNAGAERVKGFAAEEAIGQSYAILFTDADRAAGKPARQLREAERAGVFRSSDEVRLRRDGSTFPARVTLTALRAADGSLLGFSKVARDVTAEREAERRLRESDARNAFLLALEDRLRPLDGPEEVKAAAAAMLADETEAHHVAFLEIGEGTIAGPRDPASDAPASWDGPLLDACRAGRTVALSDTREAGDAAVLAEAGVRATLRVPLLRDGRLVAVLALDRPEPHDWTEAEVRLAEAASERTRSAVERARTEAALRRSEALARAQADEIEAIYAAAPVGLTVLDTSLRFVRINDRLAEVNGRPASDHIGRTVQEVVPDLNEQATAAMRRVLAGEELWGLEVTGVTPAQPGVVRTWRENWLPLRKPSGEIVGLTISAEEITGHKAAALALAESEERLRLAMAGVGLAAWETDLDTGENRWDERMPELLALPREAKDEAQGRWLDLIHSDDRARVEAAFRGGAESGERFEVEFRVRRGDGRTCWLASRGRLVPGTRRMVGVAEDVTARHEARRAQAFRLELNETLRDLSDPQAMTDAATALLGRYLGVAQAGFAEVEDDQAHIVVRRDWNDGRIPSIVGRWPLEAFGPAFVREMKAGHTVVVPDVASDPRTNAPKIRATFAGLATRAFVAVGLVREARMLALLFLHEPEPRAWTPDEVALVEEVVERLWSAVERAGADARLRASEERMRRISESGMIGVGFGEDSGRILEMNDALLAMIGRTREDAEAGRIDWRALTAPEFRDADVRAGEDLARDGVCRPYEKEYLLADGRRLPVQVSAALIDPSDPARGHIVLVMDLSRQKAAESALQQLNAELEARVAERTASLQRANAQLAQEMAQREAAQMALAQSQKLEALGQLTSGIAHDFNNVIAAISGGFSVIRRRTQDPRLIDVATHGEKAAERGGQLVKQLLSFARQQALQTRAVDLGALLREAGPLLRRSLGPGAELILPEPVGLPPVVTDPVLLESALINLAVNARDAMPDGGTLRLSARVSPLDEPGRPPELDGVEAVVLSVADTGTGMSPEILARVVEPFFTTKGPGKGTGLGLAMVHGFLQQSGGALRIESREGQGTTMRLYLRRAGTIEPEARASTVPTVAPVAATILLVDDDAAVRGVTAAQLADWGHEVVEAAGADEALAALASRSVDLVLTDVIMGGIDGVTLAEELRRRRPGLPILFMTGHSDRARLAGEVVLDKPFAPEALAREIGRLLLGQQSSAEEDAALDRLGRRLRAEALRSLLGHWREVRGGGRVPVFDGFDPSACSDPDRLAVAQVDGAHVPLRFRWVRVGRALGAALGHPIEGTEIAVRGEDEPGSLEAAYRRCARTARPIYESLRIALDDGEPDRLERLLLPWTSDGKRVDWIVGGIVMTGPGFDATGGKERE